MTDSVLPRIALTMGDVAGIGPELVARAAIHDRVTAVSRPVVVGHPEVLRKGLELIGSARPVAIIEQLDVASAAPGEAVLCWNPSPVDVTGVDAGTVNAAAGQAAYDYLVAAAEAALAGTLDAIVTAPLNKYSLRQGGCPLPGHTEILADVCGRSEVAMMLYAGREGRIAAPHGLGVAHVTLHTSIASVPGLLTTARIAETIRLVHDFMRRMGCTAPRVGVCALNPHAGEQGLFGDEEARIIAPAVEAARRDGIDASDPIPADALMRRAVDGEFDGVAAIYHDQGHIALKLVAFETAVNVTLGLPIVRTSPSHGTAFDIAWQGQAKATGMLTAIEAAAQLAATRDESA
ncbi:4-hydroxythreonine-4-phosphate dehydrogenase [Maioricimonas rarisocia]|uniref:4-hydroxythreonine-4-phosphate dehydrogenase n=1 Tax=Maioricimonas rarisocia TaxID=2528026 RepID=A0A517Z9U0_9PLAN|nr:4-hydroxythreonine-4-phosphate dehydrogenase PdxA [Maioricimonas rarisocia]QDU39254.1 4-hydroxythreonine-4-phosphate dehydrogenase [Maioricimonas rarisocia]